MANITQEGVDAPVWNTHMKLVKPSPESVMIKKLDQEIVVLKDQLEQISAAMKQVKNLLLQHELKKLELETIINS